MSKYNANIRTIHYREDGKSVVMAEYCNETMLVLKQGETFNFSTLNLKAKFPLSGFITGKPLTRDIIVRNGDEVLTVGTVEPYGLGLSEIELIPKPEPQRDDTARVYCPGVVEWEAH